MKQFNRNKQSGSSLLQLVVAMGIIGVMLGFFLEVKKNSFHAREHMKTDTDLRLVKQHVISYIDCGKTLAGKVQSDGTCTAINFELLGSSGANIEDSAHFAKFKNKGWDLRGNCSGGKALVIDASRFLDGKFFKDPLISTKVYDWNGPGKNLLDESMLLCNKLFKPSNANNFTTQQYKLTTTRTNFSGNLSNVKVGPTIKFKKNTDDGNLLVRFDTSFGFKQGNQNSWIQPTIKVSKSGVLAGEREFPKVGASYVEDYALPQSGSLRLSGVKAGEYDVEFLLNAQATTWNPPDAAYYDPVNLIIKESK